MSFWLWLRKRWDVMLFLVCFLLASTIVAFVSGFLTAESRGPLYYKISAVTGAAAEKYYIQLAQLMFSEKCDRYPFTWSATRETTPGVIICKENKVCPGATFYTDCASSSACLIDMQGNVLHRWHKDFFDVWPHPKHVKSYLPSTFDEMVYWRKARLFPNGDVLVIFEGAFTPYGGGLIKIDADSNLIWKAAINAHHDLDVDPKGNIFVLTHKYNDAVENIRIDDYLTIISPGGKVLREISLYESFRNSSYAALIPANFHGDYMHTNNVDFVTDAIAADYPFLCPGDILLSHNHLGAITVLDGADYTVKWALAGLARTIHDPDFIGRGRLVFFDNGWPVPENLAGSTILEWDCINQRPFWRFTPFDFVKGIDPSFRKTDSLLSLTCGSQQLLPNGSYLITESNGGTLYEVTREKQVVWKYVTGRLDGKSVGNVFWAERFPPGKLTFLKSRRPISRAQLNCQ